jgi:hypothetical protein
MRRILSCLIAICIPLVATNGQAPAEYAVKIVCGAPDRPALAPGVYFTAINVHNPSGEAIKFQYKIVLTLPLVAPGPISQFFPATLKGDQALEIDCTDIARRAPPIHSRFFKGFVVIQGQTELDVVGVYTATASADGRVVALEIERVPVRRAPR